MPDSLIQFRADRIKASADAISNVAHDAQSVVRSFDNLVEAIEREGYRVVHNVVWNNFTLIKEQRDG